MVVNQRESKENIQRESMEKKKQRIFKGFHLGILKEILKGIFKGIQRESSSLLTSLA